MRRIIHYNGVFTDEWPGDPNKIECQVVDVATHDGSACPEDNYCASLNLYNPEGRAGRFFFKTPDEMRVLAQYLCEFADGLETSHDLD